MGARVLWIGANQSLPEQNEVACTCASNLSEALAHMQVSDFDAVLLTMEGLAVEPEICIEEITRANCHTPIVIHAPSARIADAVRWTKLGALHLFHRLDEAFDSTRSLTAARRLALPKVQNAPSWRKNLIGGSQKMHNIAEIIRLVAPRKCTVLITGETGTGKEVIARAIHAASNRSHLEMVSVNCSALPENLLEAELFGHVKGAFTGAMSSRIGRFEQARHSTLFLDEIGDMPLALQAKLLRVLQEREFQRLGSSENVRVDVRVIAATNSDLVSKVKDGGFREDLYYRLNVVPITVPQLRERPEDIPVLVEHFIDKICRLEGIPRKHASDQVLDRLQQHSWPGNVRELENAVEMAIVLSGDRSILIPADFPTPARPAAAPSWQQPFIAVPDHGLDFERTVSTIELSLLEQALRKTGGNKKLAAEMLRLKRTTLTAKLKSLTECAVEEASTVP